MEDIKRGALDHAVNWIRADMDVLVENGFLGKGEADEAISRIQPTLGLAEARSY